MKLTADTITTAQVTAIFHALAGATDRARLIMRRTEDGTESPESAAARLNDCLDRLQLALAEAIDPAPPVPESLKHDMEVAAS